MNLRKMAVGGLFYPDNCEQINEWFERWDCEQTIKKSFEPKAIIVPHAGYMYSGSCADKAYKLVSSAINHVVVIGPSHRVALEGASIGEFDKIQTPCGELVCNKEVHKNLKSQFDWLKFTSNAHQEHSTEVQFPFIKKYFPNAFVTEIVYGFIEPQSLSQLVQACANMPKTLIVISTDLSHFYSLEDAQKIDIACIKAIEDLHVKELKNGEACGMQGIAAAILVAQRNGWDSQILNYCTSFDQSGDKSRVVGYLSSILG